MRLTERCHARIPVRSSQCIPTAGSLGASIRAMCGRQFPIDLRETLFGHEISMWRDGPVRHIIDKIIFTRKSSAHDISER